MAFKEFNLLGTTARGNEEDACSEIWYLLAKMGDLATKVDKTRITGLIIAKTKLNPFDIIERFRVILRKYPHEFRYILRVIPIEKVVCTCIADIQKAVTELGSKVKEGETFRVTVEKRFTNISTNSLIKAAATNIKRRVDLNRPDKIVLIEVLGGLTGVSVVKPQDVLSIIKEKKVLTLSS